MFLAQLDHKVFRASKGCRVLLAQRGRQALADRLELLALLVLKGMLDRPGLPAQAELLAQPGLLDNRVTTVPRVRKVCRAFRVSKEMLGQQGRLAVPAQLDQQVTLAPREPPQLWLAQLVLLDQRGLRETPALPALPERPRQWLGLPALPGHKATTDLPALKGFRVFKVKPDQPDRPGRLGAKAMLGLLARQALRAALAQPGLLALKVTQDQRDQPEAKDRREIPDQPDQPELKAVLVQRDRLGHKVTTGLLAHREFKAFRVYKVMPDQQAQLDRQELLVQRARLGLRGMLGLPALLGLQAPPDLPAAKVMLVLRARPACLVTVT